MKYTLTVDVEISDDAAAILDATAVGGAAGAMVGMAKSMLTGPGIKSVHVVVAENESAPERPAREFGNRGAVVASEPRVKPYRDENGRTAYGRASQSDSGSIRRMGRPKTLTDMEASDGGPVREWGDRSPESLHAAGISTRFNNGADEWTPELPERKTRKPVAPATKGFKPPVVSKKRGQ